MHKSIHPVKHLNANPIGRDFAVGDIHGAFDLVLRAMDEAGFDPACDRIFSVGDLIDRGPGSHRCARFLAQPYVHAVRGNHEDMLIDLYAEGDPGPGVLEWMAQHNGFGWWLDASAEVRQDTLAAIRRLPLAIEVETPRGLVGFIHADVPAGMDWPTFLAQLECGDKKVIETALWGRDRIKSGNQDGVPGAGRVFVGHTPQWDGLRRYGNVYAIDSGAVFGELGIEDAGRLTMVNLLARTGDLDAPRLVAKIDVREEGVPPMAPFGQYAING